MKKRLLAFVLTFALVISLLPTTVLAVEGDRAVNGIYQNGIWQQSGTGSIIDPGTGIELSKTATPDPGDPNLYTIHMQVKTSTKTTVTNPDAAAVVLVMDLSNSMKTCAECGKDPVEDLWGNQKYIHDESCRYYNEWDPEAEVQNDQTRLYAAKNAALAFLAAYAGDTENANRQLAVVAFGTTSKTVLSWTNVAGTSSQGYTAATRAIDNLEIGFENGAGWWNSYSDTGGTNLEAGLQLGANLIGMDDVSQVGSKNVIALTDGVPTFRMRSWADRNSTEALCAGESGVDGSGSSGSEDNNDAAQRAANDAKTNGATLYTVCYGVANDLCYDDGPTIGSFLSGSIASAGCAYNADNTADLNEAFEAITESITSGIEGAGLVVTDPMGENIQLVAQPAGTEPLSGQDGFTWTLSDPEINTVDDTTYYTYTLTYQIRVDANAEGFDEDVYHPANQPTYLTIPGEDGAPAQQIYFPVPGVKGTTSRYTVTYLPGEHGSLSGADGSGSVIHEDIKHGVPTPDAPAVTAEEGYYFIGWEPTIAPTVTADATYIAQYAARTEITVKAKSLTEKYDGTPKSVDGYTISNNLPAGFTVEGLSASASGTDAGTYPVVVTGTAVVKDSQDRDVTSQFIVKTQDGELEIEKRNVTLTSATAQKEYDGTPLTNGNITVGGDGFVEGEGATYNVTGSQTVKGSSANTFTYTLNDGTKEENYNISKTEGTLTVIDRADEYEITVVAKSDTVTYDGKEHTVSEFETLTFVVNGQTYTVSGLTANGSGTDAGPHTVTISGDAKVWDVNHNDVTDQFTVKTQSGKLEIKKRNVTLTSATAQKEYDGTPLTNDEVTVSGDGFVEGEGATYNVTGSQTLVGTSPNYFTYELQNGTKADNYNITQAEGQLTVTNRDTPFAIALQAKSDTVLYDGTEHSVEGFVTTTFTFGDATFTVEEITAKASGTDAKQYTTETDGTAVVKDADGHDVSTQFAVTVTPGTLTITKRNVTLTSADDTKMYDGTPLTNDEVTVDGDGFVAGEGATYTVTGSQTLVGESDNAFTYVLNAGTKAENYEITTSFGKLTVTDRPEGHEFEITVKANSGTFIYDGTEKTVSGFETLEFERNGVTFTVEGLIAEASATNLGTYPVEVTGKAVVKDSQGRDVTSQFIVNTVPGELTILGRLIYDGNAQQSGLVSNIPEDNNSYETTREVELSSQVPTHTNVNDVPVLFLGWSLTKSNEIFEAGEDYGTLVNKVTFADASITVYAVWGYDRNQDTIPDARQVLIQPADITIYTGGDGYMGTVEDENGNTVGINNDTGLPEPGFYFTLPYEMNLAIREAAGTADTPADLSSYLKITATADPGTGTTEDRSWTISLYSDTNNSSAYGKYVYRFAPSDEQNPVRMQFTDEEGNIIISDEFEIENALYQNYVMSLYQGSVLADTVQAVVSINGQTISAPVGLVDGELTIRGVTDEGKPSEILPDITMPVSSITAVTGENEPTYYINGSQIPIPNQETVQLLVDEIVDDEEQSVRNTLLELANVEVTDNTKTQFKYLDLVDTSNGHVWATMGADDSLTVYWPYPEGTDQDSSFTLLHYKGLDREFAIENLENSLEDVIVYSTADDAENKLICTDNGIQFTVSSFSPFALIWTVEEEEPPYIPPYIPPYRPPVAPEQPAETPDTLNTEDHYSYIVGFVDGTVRPDASITRAEVAAIFFRLLTDETRDLYWSTTNRYTDVDPNAWYNNAVSTLSNMGILNGYDDGTFRPGATITRAEFTKIAVSFFDYADLEAEATFSDLVDGAWYESFIAAAAELGLIEGYEGNVFRPDATISRAEACTIVNRTLGRAPEKDHLLPDDEMITWPDNSNKDAWYYAQIQEATNSHDYEWQGDIEQWTGKLKERDWAALEKAWSDAYSAPGGEVMD